MKLSPSCSGISFDKGSDGFSLKSNKKSLLSSDTSQSREIEIAHKSKARNDHHDEHNNEMIVKCVQLKNTSHFDKPIENIDRVFIKGISIKSIKFSCKIFSQIAEIDYGVTNSKMILGKKSNYSLTTIVESDDEFSFQKVRNKIDEENVLNKSNSNELKLHSLIKENLESNKLHQSIFTETGLNELSTKCELTNKVEFTNQIDLDASNDCRRIETTSLTSVKSNETLSQLSLRNFENYEARSGNSYCSNIFADPKKETKNTRLSLNDHFPTSIDN